MEKLDSMEQFETLQLKGKQVFLFSANWCPDCRVIEPLIPELEQSYPDVNFTYVDRDEFIDICVENDIFGIPSFLGYSEGKEVARLVSKDRKTSEQIKTFLNEVIQG